MYATVDKESLPGSGRKRGIYTSNRIFLFLLSLYLSPSAVLVSFPSVPLQHIVCIQYTLPVVRQLYSTTQACAAPVSRQLYTAVSYISKQVYEYGSVHVKLNQCIIFIFLEE
jgi:hypothetical protein